MWYSQIREKHAQSKTEGETQKVCLLSLRSFSEALSGLFVNLLELAEIFLEFGELLGC